MTRLPRISGQEVVSILLQVGYTISGQRGSHIKMKKILPHRKVTVIIPIHDELDRGTLLGIIDQAGLTKEDFLSLFHNQ